GVVQLRSAPFDWNGAQDGALALAGHELWEDVPARRRAPLSQSRPVDLLRDPPGSVTVPRMPAPSQSRAAARRRRTHRRPRTSPRQLRRLVALVTVVGGLLGTLLVAAFSSGAPPTVPQALPPPASRLLQAGPPTPMTVAVRGALRIQMPISQSRFTKIGYHS